MAGRALALFYRPMKKFLPIKIFFDIAQWWSTQVVFIVAVQAGGHFIERQEPLVFGIVRRVAGAAAPFLTQRFVRHFYCYQFFADFAMALNAQLRNLLLEDLVDRRSVRVVTGGAGAILYRLMGNLGNLQGRAEISMAGQTDVPDRTGKERLFGGPMGIMAFAAGANGNRPMHEPLLELFGTMARDAKFRSIFTYVQ